MNDPETQSPNPEYFNKLLLTRMPFGRYKDRLLIDLPETYLVWFYKKGFPQGSLGTMLYSVYEIKLNGLEGMLDPLRSRVIARSKATKQSF